MQRGFPEDFDDWAARGNDEWSYDKVLPFYRKMENDMDIQDDYHGSDGPMPVRRRRTGTWADIQQAFYDACLAEGYPAVEDTNGPNPTGVGVSPTNNLGGIRMSAAMTHLNPMRHRLNLTVRGNVYVRRVLFEGNRAVGVEAASGGEIFTVEADRVVLSSGAIRSPQLLLLSGVGPRDHLQQFGIPVIHDSPGVGQGLWNHLSVHVTYKVKDGKTLTGDLDAPHFGLHYSSEGRATPTTWCCESARWWTSGKRRSPACGPGTTRGTCRRNGRRGSHARWGCRTGRASCKLQSPDPDVQPEFNYQYLSHPNDARRIREGIRFGARMLESDAFKDVCDFRINPPDDILNNDDALDLWARQTVGTARHVSGTCRMGPDGDDMAVVDQYCRVRGVDGLWVVDASVMPRVPRSGGIHPTVIMVGERVAEWVAAG